MEWVVRSRDDTLGQRGVFGQGSSSPIRERRVSISLFGKWVNTLVLWQASKSLHGLLRVTVDFSCGLWTFGRLKYGWLFTSVGHLLSPFVDVLFLDILLLLGEFIDESRILQTLALCRFKWFQKGICPVFWVLLEAWSSGPIGIWQRWHKALLLDGRLVLWQKQHHLLRHFAPDFLEHLLFVQLLKGWWRLLLGWKVL